MAQAGAAEPTIGGLARALGLDAPAYDAVPLLGVVQDSRKVKPASPSSPFPATRPMARPSCPPQRKPARR